MIDYNDKIYNKRLREIVSTKWLHQNLSNPNLIILDASLNTNLNGKYFGITIPNARFFDLKNIFLDKTNPLPNTVPNPEKFEFESRKLGVNQNSEIVVFDNVGIYSSPRVWWLFKIMGHEKIAVLNGGLNDWIKKGFKTKKKYLETFKTGDFKVKFDTSYVVVFKQVKKNIEDKKFTIVDARSEERFNGIDQEPRKHLKSGNIKHSINIPYQEVLKDGKFKPENELYELFERKAIMEKELVFSCGSGITACIVMLACQIGYKNYLKVYDGSWTEWAERNNLKTVLQC